MNIFQSFVTIVILLFFLENPVYAEIPEESEDETGSSLTSRLVLEKLLEHTPYSMKLEASYELLGTVEHNLTYGSIGFGWSIWEDLQLALSVGVMEVGIPTKEYSPLCFIEGNKTFDLGEKAIEMDMEIELLPLIKKYIGRLEVLFSDEHALPVGIGYNIDCILHEHHGFYMRGGPEIKIHILGSELKIADAMSISNNKLIHDGRIVLMHKF